MSLKHMSSRSGGLFFGDAPMRAIAGGSDAELIAAFISTAPVCLSCVAKRTGVPEPAIERALATIKVTITVITETWRCSACLEVKPTFHLPGAAPTPPPTPTSKPAPTAPWPPRITRPALDAELWNILAARRGQMLCTACLAKALGALGRIDRALMAAEGRGALRRHGRCVECGKDRLLCGLGP